MRCEVNPKHQVSNNYPKASRALAPDILLFKMNKSDKKKKKKKMFIQLTYEY